MDLKVGNMIKHRTTNSGITYKVIRIHGDKCDVEEMVDGSVHRDIGVQFIKNKFKIIMEQGGWVVV